MWLLFNYILMGLVLLIDKPEVWNDMSARVSKIAGDIIKGISIN